MAATKQPKPLMKLLYTLLLAHLPFFIFAQNPSENLENWNESSTMYVVAIPEVGEKTEYTFKGEEVAQFDLGQILLNHPDDLVKVYGSSLNDGIVTYYRFDSSRDDAFAPCAQFAPMLDCEGSQAFLGVKTAGDEASGGAMVVEVRPNTGAEASDLEAGDLILAIDDDPIITYTDLSKEVRMRQVGQEIVLSVDRAGSILEIPATLGTRSHQTVRYIPSCDYNKNETIVAAKMETSSSVFPNPTSGPMTWNVNGLADAPANFSLSDINGKVLVSQTVHPANNYLSHQLDVSNLVKGSYLLLIQQGDVTIEEKVLVVD